MNRISLLLIAFLSINIYGQDTIYKGEFGSEIVPKSQAEFYNLVIKDSLRDDIFHENQYHLNHTLRHTVTFSNYYSKKKERLSFKGFHINGKIRSEILYSNGKIDGHLVSYWENGKLKRKDLYKKGNFIEGQCWDETGNPVPYYAFGIDAEFPGGIKALHEYIAKELDVKQIPKSSYGAQIKISFYIDKDGSISDVELVNGADPLTNLMALKLVVEMPKWSPAMQDGVPVRVKRNLPIRLPEKTQSSQRP